MKIEKKKGKLRGKDGKLYVMRVRGWRGEVEKMGKREKEEGEGMRRYVGDDVMEEYGEGLGKGVKKEDVEY